jgi:hypothetical protein
MYRFLCIGISRVLATKHTLIISSCLFLEKYNYMKHISISIHDTPDIMYEMCRAN